MSSCASVPLATVEDLKMRWPDMPLGSGPHAETLLTDASALIRSQLPANQPLDEQVALMIVCQMVRRAMATPAIPEGATSISQSAGPFATTLGFSSGGSNNSLYLTRAEKKLLGIGRQRAGSFDLLGGTHG